jgi:hypothetical protein
MTFNRSVAPGLCDRRPYGIHILAQAGSEAARFVSAAAFSQGSSPAGSSCRSISAKART